ncbi:341_t:CDS:2 [Funneliformis mosseae]|uniref:341_t:CDS:1 n=1 Tax=Funneliformis mosseae TaxID=27381 RepID=A0A9N9B8A3_FUNMO|nr:341_t:CDS:2 [Funneliformis mosseae]
MKYEASKVLYLLLDSIFFFVTFVGIAKNVCSKKTYLDAVHQLEIYLKQLHVSEWNVKRA